MTTYDLTHGTTGNDPAWRLPLAVGVALAFGALAVAVVSRGGPTAGRPPTVVAETRDLTTTLAADGALRHEGESVVAYASAVATTSRPPSVPIGTGTATGAGTGSGTAAVTSSTSGGDTGSPGESAAHPHGADGLAVEPISAVTPLTGPAVAPAGAADLAGTAVETQARANDSVDLAAGAEPTAAGGPAAAAQDPPQTTSDPCPPPEPGATPTTTDCPTTSTTVPPTTTTTTPPTTSTPPTTPPPTEPPTTPPAEPGTTSPGSGAPDTGSTTTSGGSGPTSTAPDAEAAVLPPARLTGMLAVGERADRGSVIYMAEAEPVVALIGDLPAWRSLRADVADGPDVHQLEDNLGLLGYDVGGPADTRYTDATASAVAAWETDLGRPSPDGVVTMGEVVFLPTAGDVTGHQAAVGDVVGAGAPVLKVGASRRTVVAEVDQVEAGGWTRGTTVTLTWSDGTTSSGVVVGAGGAGTGDTVEVGVALAAADANGHGSGAPARLESDAHREQAVVVPVEAVLVHEGRSALRLAQSDGDRVVPVETGLVADGWVEITAGLAAGQEVRLPPDASDS